MWSLFWIAIFLLKIWGSITNEEKEVKYWGVPSFETHVIAENIKDNKQMHKKRNTESHTWPMKWINKWGLIITLLLGTKKSKRPIFGI